MLKIVTSTWLGSLFQRKSAPNSMKVQLLSGFTDMKVYLMDTITSFMDGLTHPMTTGLESSQKL